MSPAKKTTIALFLYGGGMRGLIPAHIMTRIEEKTGLRMAEMVDIFCGPSTGAILNAALNIPHPDEPHRPKYRARHLVKFYEREGLNIFPRDRFRELRGMVHDFNNRTLKLSQLEGLFRHGHYNPSDLGKPLRALFGNTRLHEALCTLIIPAYNIDRHPIVVETVRQEGDRMQVRNSFLDEGGHAVWLKHIKTGTPEGVEKRTPDVAIFDAVMGSCAAPTFYPCHHFQVKYPDTRGTMALSAIDGGIFDNPCISYLGAIREHVPAGHRPVIIGLGTGYTNRSIKKEDWNRYGALGVVDPVNDLPLINIFFHASESALMDSFADEMGDNLYIFNKVLPPEKDNPSIPTQEIDDASPENLKAMQRFAEAMMEEYSRQMDDVCHMLVANRDRRIAEAKGLRHGLQYYVKKITGKTGT